MRGGAFLNGKEGFCPLQGEPKGSQRLLKVGFRKKSPKYFLEKILLVFERTFKVLQRLMFRILSERLACSVGMRQSIPRESSSIEIPPSASG